MILRNEVALLKPQAPKIEGGLGIFGFGYFFRSVFRFWCSLRFAHFLF